MPKYISNYLSFSQNNQEFLIAHMPFQCIDLFSQVLVYGDDPNGYQRKPEPKHFNKIRDYVLSNTQNFKLPTSIILGIDLEDLKKILKSNNTLELDSLKTKTPIFRIVDGQHRIYGLREAAKKEKSVNNFSLPITIVVTTPKTRSIELEIFTDINSKSKRIKIDLIKLAEYDYRLKEKSITERNLVDDISIKIAYILKESREESIWHNSIKFDIHNELILGLVGVNTFMESIESIVKQYLKENPIDFKSIKFEVLKNKIDKASETISTLLFECWDNTVKSKWHDAFNNKQIEMDIDEELKTFFYKKDYYIQKTMGLKVLNGIIGDLYKEFSGSSSKTIKNFNEKIFSSKIKTYDWKTGQTFAGFSSESGFKKVRSLI